MEKDRKVSLRLRGERVDFAKAKLGVKRDGELLMLLVDMYYDYYNPLDMSFIEGVPENEVTRVKNREDKAVVEVKTDDGIVTKMINGKVVKGRYDENKVFKRI